MNGSPGGSNVDDRRKRKRKLHVIFRQNFHSKFFITYIAQIIEHLFLMIFPLAVQDALLGMYMFCNHHRKSVGYPAERLLQTVHCNLVAYSYEYSLRKLFS